MLRVGVICRWRGCSKVLLSGGAGFIGGHSVTELTDRGCSFVVLDNLHSGRIDNLHGVSRRNGFKLVRGDVRDRDAVRDAGRTLMP